MAREKLSRHELKSQDEITSKIQSFGELALARKKELTIAVVAAVVIVLAVVGWRTYSASHTAAAEAQLSVTIATFSDPSIKSDKERYDRTAAEAQKTIDSYGSTPAGIIAKYYLGLSQAGLGDQANAVKNLQEAADHGDATVKGVAQFALAGVYGTHGDTDKAIEILKQLSDSGAYSKSAVIYDLASFSESASKPDMARTYYSKVITDYPDSPLRQNSEDALKRMGFPIPSPTPAAAPAKKP